MAQRNMNDTQKHLVSEIRKKLIEHKVFSQEFSSKIDDAEIITISLKKELARLKGEGLK